MTHVGLVLIAIGKVDVVLRSYLCYIKAIEHPTNAFVISFNHTQNRSSS